MLEPGRGHGRRRSEPGPIRPARRSEEHTSELQSRLHLVCRLLLEKKKKTQRTEIIHVRDGDDVAQILRHGSPQLPMCQQIECGIVITSAARHVDIRSVALADYYE